MTSRFPDVSPNASGDPRVFRIDVQGSNAAEYFMLDDEAPPTLDAGFAGWEPQARLGRRDALWWSGSRPWQQTISCWIEAWDGGTRIPLARRQWEVLRQLREQAHEGQPPFLATLSGAGLWRPGVDWALTSMTQTEKRHATADNAMRGIQMGDLLRWRGTLVFQQRLAADVLSISKPLGVGYREHVVKTGETLRTIARTELGAESRWPEIRYSSGKAITDPSRVKVGTKLRIPPRGTL